MTSTSARSAPISASVNVLALRGAAAKAVSTWPSAALPMSTEAPRRNARRLCMFPSLDETGILFVFRRAAQVHDEQSDLQRNQRPGARVPRPHDPEHVASEKPPESGLAPRLALRGD